MSVPLAPTHSLWYESMQDMSGFVLSDITLPPLDEQLDSSISTAQTKNDFYMQNRGLPSPAGFFVEDTCEGVITEESSVMFDNFNCVTLNSKTNECLLDSRIKHDLSHTHSDQTRTSTNMEDEERISSSCKTSFGRPKVKITTTVKEEKPRYLAIIDSEEPLIKEDPEDSDLLYCTQNKMYFDIKADVDISDIFSSDEPSTDDDTKKVYCLTDFKDMGVAEEVVVMTEEDENYKTNLNVSLLDSIPSDSDEDLNVTEQKAKKESEVVFQLDPFSGLETVMDNLFNDLDGDDLYSHIEGDFGVSTPITPEEIKEDCIAKNSESPVSDIFSSNTVNTISPSRKDLNNTSRETSHGLFSRISSCQIPSRTSQKQIPLTLDIDAARAALLVDKGISDTPELLEALKPEVGKFDLIKFITTNGDPNNNAISPTVESHPRNPEPQRKGKSHLSLLDLKQAQTVGRDKPSTSGVSSLGRPARQSATRFKKMIEEGLLCSLVDSPSVSSDEEDNAPKTKKQRTTSTTSSRRRLNSDSDQSSVSEDVMKYRERRDRNNLSSKRSRQKRKMQHLMKQKELKELEDENSRLKRKAVELESVLSRVKAAWADYLACTKDNDKDRGDEH